MQFFIEKTRPILLAAARGLLCDMAMRPPISSATALESSFSDPSGDSELVWLELAEIESEGREIRDLPSDVVQTIVATSEHLEQLDPYALIGVERDAEWSEIERAYRQRLAMFHPNRWSGYRLGDLRPSLERVVMRISFAFAFLADEAAREGSLPTQSDDLDRPTLPTDLSDAGVDLSGERPTFPSSGVQSISMVKDDPPRPRPPRPPPRRIA